jgi:small-conductance mechanosensitive channel
MAYIKNVANRTSFAYQFSVDNKQDEDLIALKQRVRERNERIREIYRKYNMFDSNCKLDKVSLMARGPRKHDGRRYDSNLPHKYAVYFDVYLSEDRDAIENLRREIKDGYTPSMWRKKRDLEHKIWLIDYDAKTRVRERAA